jgi:hypothetical protein
MRPCSGLVNTLVEAARGGFEYSSGAGRLAHGSLHGTRRESAARITAPSRSPLAGALGIDATADHHLDLNVGLPSDVLLATPMRQRSGVGGLPSDEAAVAITGEGEDAE